MIDILKKARNIASGMVYWFVLFNAAPAYAEGTQTTKEEFIDKLFGEAESLMTVGNYADACPKFQKVTALAPDGIGAHLKLGACYEKGHKFRSACIAYREAEKLANEKNDPRSKVAGAACEMIEKSIPRLVIKAPQELSNLKNWGFRIDGVHYSVDLNQFSRTHRTVLWVDHGTHRLDISFDAKPAWAHQFTVENGEAKVVEVPRLPIFGQMPGRRDIGLGLALIPTGLVTLGGIGMTITGAIYAKSGEDKAGALFLGVGGGLVVIGGAGIVGAALMWPNETTIAHSPSPQLQFGIAPNGISLKGTF